MQELDFDRLQPLRVAQFSHQPGSGKGCAMQVVSYINGDIEITDYPDCSARPLARIVQFVNDRLGERGTPCTPGFGDGTKYLTPEDAITAIRLGTKTIGTRIPAVEFGHPLWYVYRRQSPKLWYVRRYSEAARVAANVGSASDVAHGAACAVLKDNSLDGLVAWADKVIDEWHAEMGTTPQALTTDAVASALTKMETAVAPA